MIDKDSRPVPRKKTFSDFGIWPGFRLRAKYHNSGLYPKDFIGEVETVYEQFALIRTKGGYYTTIHISDCICGFVRIMLSDTTGYGHFDTGRAAANQ